MGGAAAAAIALMLRHRQKKELTPSTPGKRMLKRSGSSFVVGKGATTTTSEESVMKSPMRRGSSKRLIPPPVDAAHHDAGAQRTISVVVMINMQEDFIGALPLHAVPTSYVHLGRDDAERVRPGVLLALLPRVSFRAPLCSRTKKFATRSVPQEEATVQR